jgi:hypothetical protein
MNTLILLAALSSQITFKTSSRKYDDHYSAGHPDGAV